MLSCLVGQHLEGRFPPAQRCLSHRYHHFGGWPEITKDYPKHLMARMRFTHHHLNKLEALMKQKNILASAQSNDELRTKAEALSRNPRLIQVCRDACFDKEIQAKALNDPMAFLASRGIKIPQGLTVDFFERPPRYLPFPDWTPFVFEFTNCRTYWVRECDDSIPPKCLPKEAAICFGFRLYTNPVRPI